ncbi:MAG: RNA polymerase sigma factor, partial [Gemmatimonadales bacterium]
MSNDRDAALVRDCRRGDAGALETLVSGYEKRVFSAAYRLTGNPEDAKDVTQSVFLKVFEHLDQYDDRFKFFSWVYRITVNESINLINRRGRGENLDRPEAVDELRNPEKGPESTLDQEQVSRLIQQALMIMTPDHRAVIVLRHFAELSYQDMAEALEIPEKTVKSRLFEA